MLQKRKNDFNNLVKSYFAGVSMSSDGDLLSFVAYYSSMAFHSSANLIHEISNILLAYYNSNSFHKTIQTYNVPIKSSLSNTNGSEYLGYLACYDSFPSTIYNFLVSVVIALVISLIIVSVGKERSNGSKTLQLLSGTHYITYWISNYVFDWLICVLNLISIVLTLKIVGSTSSNQNYETYTTANNLGYFFLIMLFSSFSWPIYAYLWSYLFKSEIIGFIAVLVVLCIGAFMDGVWTFLQILVQTSSPSIDAAYNILLAIEWILIFLLPNLIVKKGVYFLKIQNNSLCIDAVNSFIKGMQHCF